MQEAAKSNPSTPHRLSGETPRRTPPDGKPLIVHLVVDVAQTEAG